MNFKKIVLVTCLLLAILTMGAVSATDDNNDTLTVEDDTGEVVTTPVEDVVLEEDSDELLSLDNDDSIVESNESVSPADFYMMHVDTIKNIDGYFIGMEDCPVEGRINILVNNNSAFNEYLSVGEELFLEAGDLGITEGGTYSILIKFKPADSEELTLKKFDFHYEMDSNDSFIFIRDIVDISYYGDLIAFVKDKNYLRGTVTLSIDGDQFYSKTFNGFDTELYIRETDLLGYMVYHNEFLGNKTVKVTYNNLTEESTVSFEFVPSIIQQDAVAAGEKSFILFEAGDEFLGNVSLYRTVYDSVNNDYNPNSLLAVYAISSSAREIPLPELTPGYHIFYLNYTINGKNYSKFLRVFACENSQNFTSSISSTEITEGNSVTVTVTGPEEGGIDFCFDQYSYYTVPFTNGTVERTFSDLKAGTHVISLSYNSGGTKGLFYSKYFLVTVSKKQKTTVINEAVDASTTSIHGELVLADIATGQTFKRNITIDSINSTYSNAGNISSNVTEILNQLLNLAQIQAGDKTVTVKSQNVSDALPLARFDNRTYNWADSDGVRSLVVGGFYGTLWQVNVTVIAEYSSETVDIANAKVELSKTAFTYNAKVQKPTVTLTNGKVLKEGVDYTLDWSSDSPKNVGTYEVTVTGIGAYNGTVKATFKINKAANPLAVKAKTANVKFSAVKKKAQTLAVSKVVTFTKKGQGTLTYVKSTGNKKITINKKTGKVTVGKGLKKGTYKVKVKIKAAGNANYKASAYKTVTFKIVIK